MKRKNGHKADASGAKPARAPVRFDFEDMRPVNLDALRRLYEEEELWEESDEGAPRARRQGKRRHSMLTGR